MNKILLVLTLLATGAGAFHSARQYAGQLRQKVQAAHELWQIHTQQLASAQSEQAALTERIRELKQTLAQSRPVAMSALWSALQANRADRLPLELRQRVLAELGFNWRTSPDFIVVSKQTVRDLEIEVIRDGQLTDLAATILALTQEERGQIETVLERVKTNFADWVLSHMERTEPKDDIVAQYALPKGTAMWESVSNNFATVFPSALGRERAELILPSAQNWMTSIGLGDCDAKPPAILVRRYMKDNEQRLKVEVMSADGGGLAYKSESLQLRKNPFWQFPRTFRFFFPNGWPDVAKREGFELPEEAQKK